MEKKFKAEYDQEKDLAKEILNDTDLPKIQSLVIGYWNDCYDTSCQDILDMIVANKEKFQHLESLFVGDMESEENEVSWIIQGNYSEILDALPKLKSLKIKGSTDLELGELKSTNLESLEIICGGLPVSVIEDIANSHLPNLKRLVLYLGVEDYGFNGSVDDVLKLADKNLFKNLKHLGLVNSEIQDEIVKGVLESNILSSIEVLEFTYGTLTNEGGQAILDNAHKLNHLKTLNLEWSYLTEEMATKISKLPIPCINVSVLQQPYEYNKEVYRYPMITE